MEFHPRSPFEAGFVVADVRTLDKKRGTTKQQVYTSGAVKQDLVISAYKPNGGLEDRFTLSAGTEEGVWDFIRTHLQQLPIFVSKDGRAEVVAERQNFLLLTVWLLFMCSGESLCQYLLQNSTWVCQTDLLNVMECFLA